MLDGLVQTAGAMMFVSGFAFPRTRLVRQDVTLSLLPTTLGRDGYGIGAIAGKGEMFEGVSLVGSNMILNSRKAPTGGGTAAR